MKNSLLKIENLSLKYNDIFLFSDLNLNADIGDRIAIKGNSGGGKSSIFSIILGFYKQEAGDIHYNNIRISSNNISELRKKIAYLPQNYNVIGYGTILETILYPFQFKYNKNVIIDKSIIEKEFEKLNLDKSILNNSFDSASGGEKQRIGLIICKLLNREIILLDEPTSSLDKESKLLIIDYIMENKHNLILSISHDDEWIKRCNKILELK